MKGTTKILAFMAATVFTTGPAFALFDTDSDGLPDKWELHHFGNLSQTDTDDPDDDTLGHLAEYGLGTNPLADDSDNDMIRDAVELEYGTEPAWSDSDADGCGDGEEVFLHLTNPLDPNDHSWCGDPPSSPQDDYDEDGLFDQWELTYFNYYEYLAQTAATDHDGDGLTNLQEYNLGTNPDNLDTDWDEINDDDEVGLGTDPNNWDSDGDECSDGNEYLYYFTDPLDPNDSGC
jgi:hypothetical protein